MKTVLILRHAKSSWKDESLPDHDRPLNKRGKESAPQMGDLIRKKDLTPELVLSSTAVRARTTAELAAEACGYEGEVELSEDLYAFEAGPYLHALAGLPDKYSRVMLVGHNPAVEELIQALCGEYQPMPTAALALVHLPVEHWGDLRRGAHGKLVDLWRPKEI